jgi:hypothetical protein
MASRLIMYGKGKHKLAKLPKQMNVGTRHETARHWWKTQRNWMTLKIRKREEKVSVDRLLLKGKEIIDQVYWWSGAKVFKSDS